MMRWEMVLLSSLLYYNLLVLMKMKMFRRQSGGAWETPLTPGMTQVPGATHLALQAPHTISKHVLHVLWKLFDCCFVPLFLHLFDLNLSFSAINRTTSILIYPTNTLLNHQLPQLHSTVTIFRCHNRTIQHRCLYLTLIWTNWGGEGSNDFIRIDNQ